jgi:hypothetical protein
MLAMYTFPRETVRINTFAFDVKTSLIIDFFEISYSLRTNFSGVNHKLSVGFDVLRLLEG